jgi:GNAT superfamily N-acetyltransferase
VELAQLRLSARFESLHLLPPDGHMTRPFPQPRFLSSADGWSHTFDLHFRSFYARIFQPAFPDPDLREPVHRLKQLSDPRLFGAREPWGFVTLALAQRGNAEIPAGGILFELFRACDAALVTYISVDERHRRQGIAAALLDEARAELRVARRPCSRPLLIFAETEPAFGEECDIARLRSLGRLGFGALDFRYVQPPLAPGKHHVEGLTLLVHRGAGTSLTAISADRLAHFLQIFYRSILGEALDRDGRLLDVIAEVQKRNSIAVTPLLAHK